MPEQIFSVARPVSASFEACPGSLKCGRAHSPFGKGKGPSYKFALPFRRIQPQAFGVPHNWIRFPEEESSVIRAVAFEAGEKFQMKVDGFST